ncbi:Translation initiation factor 1A [uncultured archaeon]|nr:Translation initiation factor 1A [uncultured archaeon]
MEEEKAKTATAGTGTSTGAMNAPAGNAPQAGYAPANAATSQPAALPEGQPQFTKLRLPHRDELEMFGIVIQLHGSNHVKILCEDGKERGCRIPGKMKKKTWLRERDVVIIRLWSFQPTKADVVWRFIGMQVENLKRRGYLKNLPI